MCLKKKTEAGVDLFETCEVWKCGRRVFHSRTFGTFSARVSLAKVVAGPNRVIGLLLLPWFTSTGVEFVYICGIINYNKIFCFSACCFVWHVKQRKHGHLPTSFSYALHLSRHRAKAQECSMCGATFFGPYWMRLWCKYAGIIIRTHLGVPAFSHLSICQRF